MNLLCHCCLRYNYSTNCGTQMSKLHWSNSSCHHYHLKSLLLFRKSIKKNLNPSFPIFLFKKSHYCTSGRHESLSFTIWKEISRSLKEFLFMQPSISSFDMVISANSNLGLDHDPCSSEHAHKVTLTLIKVANCQRWLREWRCTRHSENFTHVCVCISMVELNSVIKVRKLWINTLGRQGPAVYLDNDRENGALNS